MLILGERHLRKVLAESARHHDGRRVRPALQQRPPEHETGHTIDITAPIERRRVAGGPISQYRRAA